MKVTVLCPHFWPDVAPTGEVMTSIVEGLAERGHRIEVVTSLPWYRHHRIEPGWEGRLALTEERPWGRITRVHPFPTDKTNIPARALAFGGFTALASAVGALSGRRPDVVLAMSPPLTLGVAGWLVARARRAPFVFNIQDVFPDVAIELGLLKGRRVIEVAYAAERFLYQRADAVTVLSDDLAANVRQKLSDGRRAAGRRQAAEKVRVIPNFVDVSRIEPGPKESSYRAEHGLEGKRVVMYAGNVGLSQSLGLVLDAAAAIRDSDVVFVINGAGAARPALEAQAASLGNVRFVDLQPAERLPEVLAAADVHVVPLKKGLARSSVPSKSYSIMAAGRPIVASVDAGTEIARMLERSGGGVWVPPEDPEQFTKAIRRLIEVPEEAEEMGRAGRRFVEGWVSPQAVARRYEELFEDLAGI